MSDQKAATDKQQLLVLVDMGQRDAVHELLETTFCDLCILEQSIVVATKRNDAAMLALLNVYLAMSQKQ